MYKQRDWARKMQEEYRRCGEDTDIPGQPKYSTSVEIEACVERSLSRQGIATETAGSTGASGNVSVKPVPGKCGPLVENGTRIHENVHSATARRILRQHGRQVNGRYVETPESRRVWNSAESWWKDEVNAYGSEIPFYDRVIRELSRICCETSPPAPPRAM
jgi:hypothetical protein